jgi:virulence-associated protein VagC
LRLLWKSKQEKLVIQLVLFFPKDISLEAGKTYTIIKVEDAYIMKPKKEDIFKDSARWTGFRASISSEDAEWDQLSSEGKEL